MSNYENAVPIVHVVAPDHFDAMLGATRVMLAHYGAEEDPAVRRAGVLNTVTKMLEDTATYLDSREAAVTQARIESAVAILKQFGKDLAGEG